MRTTGETQAILNSFDDDAGSVAYDEQWNRKKLDTDMPRAWGTRKPFDARRPGTYSRFERHAQTIRAPQDAGSVARGLNLFKSICDRCAVQPLLQSMVQPLVLICATYERTAANTQRVHENHDAYSPFCARPRVPHPQQIDHGKDFHPGVAPGAAA